MVIDYTSLEGRDEPDNRIPHATAVHPVSARCPSEPSVFPVRHPLFVVLVRVTPLASFLKEKVASGKVLRQQPAPSKASHAHQGKCNRQSTRRDARFLLKSLRINPLLRIFFTSTAHSHLIGPRSLAFYRHMV